jgi:hypothetical protein
MSPYAQSAPGNGDYLWRRYNNALRAAVSTEPSCRAYIDLDDLPISLFDPGSAIPYIHRTGEGYYQSGVKLGRSILSGIKEPVLRLDNIEGTYTPAVSNMVGCSGVSIGYGSWSRVGNTIDVAVRLAVTNTTGGVGASFDLTVPVKAKTYPKNVTGNLVSFNGELGMAIPVSSQQTVRLSYVPKNSGPVACNVSFRYRVNDSDSLPNSPPGTT